MEIREYYNPKDRYIHQVISFSDGTKIDMKTVKAESEEQAKAIINRWHLLANQE